MSRARVLLVLALAGLGGACRGREAPRAEAFRALAVGDTTPRWTTATLAGDSARIGPGQPVTVLNVWATWCESCREEMATLEALHREFAPRGVRVLAVSVDQGAPNRVRRFVADEHLTFAVAHDRDGDVQQRFRILGVPTTLVLDRDGTVRWARTGAINGLPGDVRAALQEALGSGR